MRKDCLTIMHKKKIADLKTVKEESTSGTKRKRDDHKEITAKRVKNNVEEDSNEIIDDKLNGAPVSQEIDKDAQVPEEIVDKDELNNKQVSQGADKGTLNLSDHEDELFDWSPKSQDQSEDATPAASSDEES
ncbi:uncharacterized protein LOC116416997 [Nasonia vitripennis]|uniref:Uncharacterized protein n=1 Tax=Nasonia vitripennis TaxID=7425 RepID=A0A7M7QCC9_NASVI|nr:uncharacterized protein LOC116416997 [Nasonia vitripennis]